MTVNAENPVTAYAPTGSAMGPFGTVFTFVDLTDVTVAVETDGLEAALTYGLDYSVAATAPESAGGSVTLAPGAVPLGGWQAGAVHRLLVRRRTPASQTEPFGQVDGFRPPVSEGAWDKAARLDQEHSAGLARAVVSPYGAPTLTIPSTFGAENTVLGLDGTGRPSWLSLLSSGLLTVSGFVQTLLSSASAAAMRALLDLGSTAETAARVRPHNDWPNPDFQVMDGSLEVVKWKSDFSGRRPALVISAITSVTLFDTRAEVTFLCANTGELRVDETIRCAAPADVSLRQTVLRVQSIVPNVSFKCTLEKLSNVPSVLTGFTATVVTRGDDTGAAGGAIGTSGVTKNIDDGVSGWPTYQVDDVPAHRALFKGCIRYLVWQKKTAGVEYLYHNTAPEDVQHYSNMGRVFGCAAVPKTAGASCQAFISNSGALVYGSTATAVGARTWIEVGATIGPNPTNVREGVAFSGPVGAIFLMAEFLSDWGVGPLRDGAYCHRQHTVRTNNTVSPWVFVEFTTPPAADISDSFGFGVDVVQASNGIVGPNVTTMTGMVEGRSNAVGNKLGFKTSVFGQIQYGTILRAPVAANLATTVASSQLDNQWGAIRMKSGRFVVFGLDNGSQPWATVSLDQARFEIGTQPS